MPKVQAPIDPLAAFLSRLGDSEGTKPIPLISTRFDIVIDAGLATVTTTRRFRNAEAAAIEAIMTFPMPVHAVLFELEARIDDRELRAFAQRREEARATYEDAIEQGKSAVLHEEVLRGIHMLSVANLRPGGEVEIRTRWAAALALIGGAGQLRIPLTVGQVYGCSGLADTDDLIGGAGEAQRARLTIRNLQGDVSIAGVQLTDGSAEIPLDRPIDIAVPAWTPTPLAARAADGRRVELRLVPVEGDASRRVDLAMLIDCSGSMAGAFSSQRSALTNHGAALAVARGIAATLADGDRLDLWEFNHCPRHVGALARFDAASIDALAKGLSWPNGGTETGFAIKEAARQSETGDLLLITDGMSHALEVQALARLGRRISVLLIGEDSLEANVGHLAALTGGELFIATDANLDAVAGAMAAAVRMPFAPAEASVGALESASARRGGVDIAAHWTNAQAPAETGGAVAAMAAAVAIAGLASEAAAAELAEAEGLVTHLTSLVLVDEASSEEGLPVMRKVRLETPAVSRGGLMRCIAVAGAPSAACAERSAPPAWMPPEGNPEARLRSLGRSINWNVGASPLLAGDLSALDHWVRDALLEMADAFLDITEQHGVDALTLVIMLAAQHASGTNRTAARVAKMLAARLPEDGVRAVLEALGLTG